MKIVFVIIIAFHGLIHLLGFVKAFELSEIKELTQPVSKPFGVLWLVAFLLLIATALLFALKNNYWWELGIIAVLISQMLVVIFWRDAKFGTIPNIIILLVSINSYANYILMAD
ncbi:MAG: hypothetical protein GXO77_02655 [Calditrichaeota bacterium]|nr:hypothetical protein [Calditrichota bacterium]